MSVTQIRRFGGGSGPEPAAIWDKYLYSLILLRYFRLDQSGGLTDLPKIAIPESLAWLNIFSVTHVLVIFKVKYDLDNDCRSYPDLYCMSMYPHALCSLCSKSDFVPFFCDY